MVCKVFNELDGLLIRLATKEVIDSVFENMLIRLVKIQFDLPEEREAFSEPGLESSGALAEACIESEPEAARMA